MNAMTMVLSDEQQALRRSVRRLLTDHAPLDRVRRGLDGTGHDTALWSRMADGLGLLGLAVPEAYGGSGGSLVELGIVFEELGRSLACVPYLGSALAVLTLLECPDEAARRDLLPGLADGGAVGAVALADDTGAWDMTWGAVTATGPADGEVLTGHRNYVVDGTSASLVLVAALRDGTPALYAVDTAGAGLVRTPLGATDRTRKLARLAFTRTPARRITGPGSAAPAVERVVDLARIMLANEQVGGAQRCLEMSVDHARTRHQFGRPIGSFQAVKHACADMFLAVESARSAAGYATWSAAQRSADVPVAAVIAAAACADAYSSVAAATIQVHGGIGFTWEHDAHLFLKRAKAAELLFGDAAFSRELLAARLGVTSSN